MKSFGNACMIILCLVFLSCSSGKRMVRKAGNDLLGDAVLKEAHTGISVFDPGSRRFLYDHQGGKYFVPASNTKIITCYAAMKYLGEKLEGIRWADMDTAIFLFPTGDPTLLHPDYMDQPVIDFLAKAGKPLYLSNDAWKTQPLGRGWSWDDYSEDYMAERSSLPVYGNVIRWVQSTAVRENPAHPGDTLDAFIYSEPEVQWPVDFTAPDPKGRFRVKRDRDANRFLITEGREKRVQQDVPFVTDGAASALALLADTLHREIRPYDNGKDIEKLAGQRISAVYSRPTDSMLRPMMHRSDNFFAEQALLMAGKSMTGRFREQEAIDSILATGLAGMPQVPRWVDGSGLSRYNLFSPKDFVWVLDRMRTEFGIERVRGIFPSPGSGTLRSYPAVLTGRVFAKTGTLSGVVALSGYLHTRQDRWLIFSILVNNHNRSAQEVRNLMGEFLRALAEAY
jgi:D-alanyl-D-alanine carboxypeptidase/D-alanyl-D-alanine-endopeptidase (penicillin-binding protein 4)